MAKPDSPLQSFFRLTIMIGAAIVGGMAFKVYGPPPEKIGPALSRGADYAMQVVNNFKRQSPSSPGEAAAIPLQTASVPSLPASPLPAPMAEFSAAERTVSPSSPTPSAWPTGHAAAGTTMPPRAVSGARRSPSIVSALVLDPTLEPLVAELESAGASALKLTAWGADGQLVRFSCVLSTPGSTFLKILDSIEANPRAALTSVLAQLPASGSLAQAY